MGTETGARVIIYDLKDAKKVKMELKGHDKTKRISSVLFQKAYKPSSSQVKKSEKVQEEPKVAPKERLRSPIPT